jgi:hypothetical protein
MFEGFIDASGLVKCGIYILLHKGKVMFIGKATSGMLAKIANHRSAASKSHSPWLPIKGVVFDQILIKTVHPDRLAAEYACLVAEHAPKLNLPPPFIHAQPSLSGIRRV